MVATCLSSWSVLASAAGQSAFLEEMGRVAIGQQLGSRVQQAAQQSVGQPPLLSGDQLDGMGKSALRDYARSLGVQQKAVTVKELRDRLKEHLKKPR